jgi:hypothetical protein
MDIGGKFFFVATGLLPALIGATGCSRSSSLLSTSLQATQIFPGFTRNSTQTSQFQFSARGNTYTIATESAGTAFTFGGHWLYEPSGILPSAATGNQYVLLFSSNLVAGKNGNSGEAIFMSTSSDGVSFSAPTAILPISAASNICDIADARPVWDGSNWHVYIQALPGNYRTCNPANNVHNVVFEAMGPSLTQLSWVTTPGTNQAIPILQGSPSNIGIGEAMQWFDIASYASFPGQNFLASFNDWNSGGQLFTSLTPDGTSSLSAWSPQSSAYDNVMGLILPDVILAGARDTANQGLPAIALGANCLPSDGRYVYGRGIGFYPNFLAENAQSAGGQGTGEIANAFNVEGSLASVTSDSNGPRMSSPHIARNAFGALDASDTVDGSGNPVKVWRSLIFYNDAQMNRKSGDNCVGYTNWGSSDQRFSFSKLTITETPPPPPSSAPVLGPMTNSCSGSACTAFWQVQGATQCSYAGTTLNVTNGVTDPFSFGAGGGPFVGSEVLSCTGSGGTTQGTYVAVCDTGAAPGSCSYSGPFALTGSGPAPTLGGLSVSCDASTCTAVFQAQNASNCFYANTNEPGGADASSGQATFTFGGNDTLTVGPSGFTGTAQLLCVGPGGSTTGTYTASCAPDVNINQCVYTGPT